MGGGYMVAAGEGMWSEKSSEKFLFKMGIISMEITWGREFWVEDSTG